MKPTGETNASPSVIFRLWHVYVSPLFTITLLSAVTSASAAASTRVFALPVFSEIFCTKSLSITTEVVAPVRSTLVAPCAMLSVTFCTLVMLPTMAGSWSDEPGLRNASSTSVIRYWHPSSVVFVPPPQFRTLNAPLLAWLNCMPSPTITDQLVVADGFTSHPLSGWVAVTFRALVDATPSALILPWCL